MAGDPDQIDEVDSSTRDSTRFLFLEFELFLGFWACTWLGIILAGATFGLLGGLIGVMYGAFLAFATSIPIILTCMILSWAVWSTPFSRIWATIAGAGSGFFSTALLLGMPNETAVYILGGLAAVTGGLGAGIAAFTYSQKRGWPNRFSGVNSKYVWQFSLRDLFLRFTAISCLIAAWTLLLAKFWNTRLF